MRHPADAAKRLTASVATRQFSVTEAVYAAGTELAPHRHEAASLAFNVAGAYDERIGPQSYHCDGTTLLIKPAGLTHSNTFACDVRMVVVDLLEGETARELAGTFERCYFLRSATLRPSLLEISRELRRRDALTPLAVEVKVVQLLVDLARSRDYSAGAARLQKAVDLMQGLIGEQIDLGMLAAGAGLPLRSFVRQFRREFGCTVHEYARRLRVERAKQLLLASDVDLRTLALELGFYDQSHFTGAFRKSVGMTPQQYRRFR